MSRRKLIACLAVLPVLLGGCSMCCGPFDFDYPMFQSRYSRTDPQYGRVGSIFSDPNIMPGSPALTNADVPREDRRPEDDSELRDEQVDPFRGVDPGELEIPSEEGLNRSTGWSRRQR